MQYVVDCGIDGGVQSEPLVLELNHGFVRRHAIRFHSVGRLQIGLLDPVVDSRSTASDTES